MGRHLFDGYCQACNQLIMRIAGTGDKLKVRPILLIAPCVSVFGCFADNRAISDSDAEISFAQNPRCGCVFQIPLFLLAVALEGKRLKNLVGVTRAAVADVGHNPRSYAFGG